MKYSSNINDLDWEMYEDDAIFIPKEVKRICKTCGNYFRGNCTFKHIKVQPTDICLQYK